MDGYPVKGNKFAITNYGKQIIDKILASEDHSEDETLKKLLNASMHFHTARKFDAQIHDLYIYDEPKQLDKEGKYSIKFSPRDQQLINAREVNANVEEIATVSYI